VLSFERRITLGELLLIIGLIVSTITFFFKSGSWVGKIETQFEQVQRQLVEVKGWQEGENQKLQTIDERLSRVEGATKIIRRQTQ
jgi:archaellum component FlaC